MGRRMVEAGLENPARAAAPAFTLRAPTTEDGAAIWELVRRCKPLDENSCYAYLILCEHFSGTCVVAEKDGEIIGFVSAYIPPRKSDVVFVWQVAVDERARGMGLAGAMLDEVIGRPACAGVRYMETTVSPGNVASETLFRKLAARRDAVCNEKTLFTGSHFGRAAHEDEVLFRIGPLNGTGQSGTRKRQGQHFEGEP